MADAQPRLLHPHELKMTFDPMGIDILEGVPLQYVRPARDGATRDQSTIHIQPPLG